MTVNYISSKDLKIDNKDKRGDKGSIKDIIRESE
jgi:hypothetical protein